MTTVPDPEAMNIEQLTLRDLTDPQTWRSFFPKLHVEDHSSIASVQCISGSDAALQVVRTLLQTEGYFQASHLNWGLDLSLMAETVRQLDRAGIPPVFSFLYDEFWLPFYKLSPIYKAIMGDYFALPDFWVWNVDPSRGDSGWRPHRDKGRVALFPDGTPKSITTWIPLSSATPLNGCMYIVPAHLDPTYNTPEENNWQFEYGSVRALPAEPGDAFIWTQAALHWGSRTSPRGGASRVSMAFEFQRADVAPMNKPLLPPLHFHSFDFRIKLIAKQVLQYRHMYKLSTHLEQLAGQIIAGQQL